MIVMKFGGTSLATASRMEQVVKLAFKATLAGQQPVLVLSAMSGVTNALIGGANQALLRDLSGAMACLELVVTKHVETIDTLFAAHDSQPLRQDIEQHIDELRVLYKGISYLGELTKRSLDAVAAAGELMSSKIVASLARQRGLPSQWLDARTFIITDDAFGKANPLWDRLVPATRTAILDRRAVPITQGFIGATTSGITTTLGRGGSDYTASILGVAVDAAEIQIWTDVDGMLTADPRIIPDAQVLPEVSFQEASELAYFGAKVLHPLTIKPAIEKNIPVRILNTLSPDKAGTLIRSTVNTTDTIRAIASKKGITAILLSSPRMLMSYGFLARIFALFDKYQTPIDLISTSEVSVALTIDHSDHLKKLTQELSEYGEVETLSNVAIISVVGSQFRAKSGIAGRVFNALANTNILMISGGASDINLSFVLAEDQADRAVQQLHAEFFGSSTKNQPCV